MCGGPWRNAVYKLGPGPVSPPGRRPAASENEFVGCFIDAGDRDLRVAHTSDPAMSIEVCSEHCRAQNAPYFAMQAGADCHCGASFGRYGHAAPAECSTPCYGNHSQMCGGPWRNSVYRTAR
jgi:hypothetical protein